MGVWALELHMQRKDNSRFWGIVQKMASLHVNAFCYFYCFRLSSKGSYLYFIGRWLGQLHFGGSIKRIFSVMTFNFFSIKEKLVKMQFHFRNIQGHQHNPPHSNVNAHILYALVTSKVEVWVLTCICNEQAHFRFPIPEGILHKAIKSNEIHCFPHVIAA